jgi:NAD(P)-dependent dehydrogenase (short-subunit alcohol dehydrogenase family)
MQMRLENKVALITGGGTGIGAATARLFAREGAKVLVTGRRPEPIEKVAAEVDGVAVGGDTSDPTHAAEAVAAAVSAFGGLDVLVASAGIGGMAGSVGDMDDENWRRTLDVNLTGPMVMTRAAIPAMLERGGGSVVLVSSTNALAASPSSVVYDASKAAVNALARGIAVDHGPQGIRANALCPGWVITPMADASMEEMGVSHGIGRQEAYDLATAHVPVRRPGTAEEMANCCLFLASDESSIVNGATLVADGGALAVELTSTMFGAGSGG